MKRALVLVCFLFYTATSLSAQTTEDELYLMLDSFLSQEQRIELVQKGQLIRSLYDQKNAAPRFTPPFVVPQTFAAGWDKENPLFLIEALYLRKKEVGSEKNIERISRVVRSISKLEGLQYYSSSRKKMRTLYETSYIIADPQHEDPLPDPLDNPAPDFSVYVLQKDLTFDKNIYRYRFCTDADSAGFMSTNVNTLKYSLFKAIEPGELQVSVAVTDLGDYLLIHALTRAQFTAPSILRERVQNSFMTRGEAVYNWFVTQYGNVSGGIHEAE